MLHKRVCFVFRIVISFLFYNFFLGGEATSGLMLIGSQSDDTLFVVSCTVLDNGGLDGPLSLFSLE